MMSGKTARPRTWPGASCISNPDCYIYMRMLRFEFVIPGVARNLERSVSAGFFPAVEMTEYVDFPERGKEIRH
jgi:hypothetical protein